MSMTRKFDAVLFDAGHTLLRVEPSVGHVYAHVAARYGLSSEPALLNRAFRQAWSIVCNAEDTVSPFSTSENDERVWWRNVVADTFIIAGYGADFGGLFEAFFEELYEVFARPEVWYVYDDVEPTLQDLTELGVRTAIVSNWDSRLHGLLDGLNLTRWFEFVLTSAEIGRRKPHPLLFETALKRLGLPRERTLHIGDSYEDDVIGSQQAGLVGLMLDRQDMHAHVKTSIRSLTEIAPIVRGEN